jgi:hypothetical protein
MYERDIKQIMIKSTIKGCGLSFFPAILINLPD